MAHKDGMEDAKQAAKNGMPLAGKDGKKHPKGAHKHGGRHSSRHGGK